MELNRKHFRVIIFYNFRLRLTQQQCIDELNLIFGDEASSRTSVYREIETNFGISGTSIHSILQEHLSVKNICSPWIPRNFSIAQKKLVSIGRKKSSKNTIAVLRNIVTGDE